MPGTVIKLRALAAVFAVCQLFAEQTRAQEPVLKASVWKYGGAISAPSQDAIDSFRSIVADKILMLRSSLSDTTEAKYLASLAIDLTHQNENLSDPLAAWQTEQALLLMSGILVSPQAGSGAFTVASTIYIGDLAQRYGSPTQSKNSFRVDLPISSEELGTIQDTHSLLIIYALTLDALSTNRDHQVVFRLIAMAHNNSHDMQLRGRLNGDAALISKEMATIAQSLRYPAP